MGTKRRIACLWVFQFEQFQLAPYRGEDSYDEPGPWKMKKYRLQPVLPTAKSQPKWRGAPEAKTSMHRENDALS